MQNFIACRKSNEMKKMTAMMTWRTWCTSLLHIISLGNGATPFQLFRFDMIAVECVGAKQVGKWARMHTLSSWMYLSVSTFVYLLDCLKQTPQPFLCVTQKLHDNALWASEPIKTAGEGGGPMRAGGREKKTRWDAMRGGKKKKRERREIHEAKRLHIFC